MQLNIRGDTYKLKKQITGTFTLIGISAAFLCSIIVFFVLQLSAQRQTELYVRSAGQVMSEIFDSSSVSVSELDILQKDNLRVTWIDKDGAILYDTAGATENHADRPEFIDALAYGYGESKRLSDTLSKETFYYANLLNDGSVLRISATGDSVWAHVYSIAPFIVGAFVLVVIFSRILAKFFTIKIMKPIEIIDIKKPLENDTYEEFAPLLRRINSQNTELRTKLEEVQSMRNDLAAIMKSMTEGLIVLNKDGLILSVNESALKILEQEHDAVLGQPLLALRRDSVFVELANACEKRENVQTELMVKGRIYRVLLSQAQEGGSILMLVDETEKCESEKIRREFSANVSHELKTPLQSILGYAELLTNDLVNEKDKPNFYENIYKECRRLTSLIQDIIDLSRLDESGGTIAKESVNIYNVAQNVVSTLEEKAAKKKVSIKLNGKKAGINAVPALVHEMLYNLVDNAVTYNKDGGKIDIEVKNQNNKVHVIVKDTGIGIPQEHQSRIFERFYRVDKSHSRSTGGTGLGLSIVKHAAAVHGATVHLQSIENIGTTVEIIFDES